jgi:Zn-dependent protease
MSEDLILNVFRIVVLLYSVVLHELAHGLAARSMGDMTAERAGRLTLNPIPHLDLFGSIILPILTTTVGGFMFGYAKPVPYDPSALNDRAYGPAKVAFAGPAVNLALAVLFGLVIRFFAPMLSPILLEMLALVVWINLVLAVFNLLPVPPLDGHWLLMTFLPARFHAVKVALYRYQWYFLALCIFFVFPALVPALGFLFTLLTGHRLF